MVLYWLERDLQPGEKRQVGFAYGLGSVTGSERGGHLALTVNGNFEAGQTFSVIAYVNNPQPGETVTLTLPGPAGTRHRQSPEQVPALAPGAGWQQHRDLEREGIVSGEFPVKVKSSSDAEAVKTVTIQPGVVVKKDGSKLADLKITGPLVQKEVFTATATVKNPSHDQGLTLVLPEGLARMEGNARQEVPPLPKGQSEGESKVVWKIRADKAGTYTVAVRSDKEESLSKDVTITPAVAIDGGKLIALAVNGPLVQKQVFTLSATVKNPMPDQHLTVTLPEGLEKAGGEKIVNWCRHYLEARRKGKARLPGRSKPKKRACIRCWSNRATRMKRCRKRSRSAG